MERKFPSRSKIVVVPLGEIDYMLVNRLASQLVSYFNLGVDVLQGVKLPVEAYNEQRGQYYSTVILNKLEILKSSPEEKMLGVVDEDLYIPTQNFVFGEADPIGKAAVISLFRLKGENYEILDEEKVLFSRALKEAIHHLGHLWGFADCRNPKCVMYLPADMSDVDRKGIKFCDNCLRRVEVWKR
jgi:archaemetzincin